MSQDTATLQQASVRHHCKAVRMPAIGANFVALAEQAVREKRSHIGYLEALLAMEGEERDQLIVIAIILIIITIALPRLSRARMFSQETAAIGAIRTLHTVQVQYYSQYGRYAASLTELGPPTSGAPGPAAADLIDATLAGGTKSGHKFTMTGNASGYVINVVPESYGDRKSTRLNSSHLGISYAVFCLKKKNKHETHTTISLFSLSLHDRAHPFNLS